MFSTIRQQQQRPKNVMTHFGRFQATEKIIKKKKFPFCKLFYFDAPFLDFCGDCCCCLLIIFFSISFNKNRKFSSILLLYSAPKFCGFKKKIISGYVFPYHRFLFTPTKRVLIKWPLKRLGCFFFFEELVYLNTKYSMLLLPSRQTAFVYRTSVIGESAFFPINWLDYRWKLSWRWWFDDPISRGMTIFERRFGTCDWFIHCNLGYGFVSKYNF